METEIPTLLRGREAVAPERFTFHSSRMRMKKVSKSELKAMDGDSDRCALELSDAKCDVIGYACLVAIMSMGLGYHRQSEARLGRVASENGGPAPIVTSAGALVAGLQCLGARNIVVITPYLRPLTKLVCDYLESESFRVLDNVSLEVDDNLKVGMLDPMHLLDVAKNLDLSKADALVISACVQMPSLPVVQAAEQALRLPVVSAATCTAFCMLRALGLETKIPNAGAILSGRYN